MKGSRPHISTDYKCLSYLLPSSGLASRSCGVGRAGSSHCHHPAVFGGRSGSSCGHHVVSGGGGFLGGRLGGGGATCTRWSRSRFVRLPFASHVTSLGRVRSLGLLRAEFQCPKNVENSLKRRTGDRRAVLSSSVESIFK